MNGNGKGGGGGNGIGATGPGTGNTGGGDGCTGSPGRENGCMGGNGLCSGINGGGKSAVTLPMYRMTEMRFGNIVEFKALLNLQISEKQRICVIIKYDLNILFI